MAFPTVQTTNHSNSGPTPTATHAASLPASLATGDLILLFASVNGSNMTINTPTDWTQVGTFQIDNTQRMHLFKKTSDGGEGATVTLSNSTSTNRRYTTISYRIDGAQNSDVEMTAVDTSGGSDPDCPSETASWGSDDNLWLAYFSSRENGGAAITVGTYPTGFTSGILDNGGELGCQTSACAQRNEATATKDPGAYSATNDNNTISVTVVIRPEVVASAASTLMLMGVGA